MVNYSKLGNLKSAEMCIFLKMLFESRNTPNTGELQNKLSQVIKDDEHRLIYNKIQTLELQKEKIAEQIDRLSGPHDINDEDYAKFQKYFEIYKTINKSILKQHTRIIYM